LLLDNGILWGLFGAAVLPLLALDLGVLSRRPHAVTPREALLWSIVWIALGLLFGGAVWYYLGADSAVEYLTGYAIEKSLSVDNVFLFAVIFSYFRIPPAYQHRVLLWGVVGALVMRAIMITAGAVLIARFHAVIYVFGGLLILTGIRMYVQRDQEMDPSTSPVVRWLRKRLRIVDQLDGERFFTRTDGVRHGTPLLLALAVIEFTDLVFAVDSIPAIFAVTQDPFIVFTSNVFAVMGLRSLYFLLAGAMGRFHYLKPGLAAILVFVGTKMLLPFKLDPFVSLAVVVGILAIAVAASLLLPVAEHAAGAVPRKEHDHAA
jgi:tellurite resistance protein TerC